MTQLMEECDVWSDFLAFAAERCTSAAFDNWLAPIKVAGWTGDELMLEVPNIFVREYLLENYKQDLCAFLPVRGQGEPAIRFVVVEPEAQKKQFPFPQEQPQQEEEVAAPGLNPLYRFETFIEGPSNQFVKSAAFGVATPP